MALSYLPEKRFEVFYQITGKEEEILTRAQEICFEQTVETDPGLITQPDILEAVVGKVEHFRKVPLPQTSSSEQSYLVKISYWEEITAYQLPQLLNVIMGNSSLKPGLKVVDVYFKPDFYQHFSGPKFGIQGIRKLLNIYHRPLLACPLKPLGLGPRELGQMAASLVAGGIDIIKDDHGIVNHSFCSFDERLAYITEAIANQTAKNGKKVLYFISITDTRRAIARYLRILEDHDLVGILVSPFVTGLDLIPEIARENRLRTPIMLHPAFIGSAFNDPCQGFHQAVLLGTMWRLAGGDLMIFPNFGGRFSFTPQACRRLARKLTRLMGPLPPAFPVPAGGINVDQVPDLKQFYGPDVVFLMGSSLFRISRDYRRNVARMMEIIESLPR